MKRALVVAAALRGVLLASCAHAGNGTPITATGRIGRSRIRTARPA